MKVQSTVPGRPGLFALVLALALVTTIPAARGFQRPTSANGRALLTALESNDVAQVRTLVEHRGMDVNTVIFVLADGNQVTPLTWVIYNGAQRADSLRPVNPDLLRYLLEHGADTKNTINGQPPLEWLEGTYATYCQQVERTPRVAAARNARDRTKVLVDVLSEHLEALAAEAAAEEDFLSTSDWVEAVGRRGGKVIRIRNDSQTKSIRVTSWVIYDCQNADAGECGMHTPGDGPTIHPGQVYDLDIIQPPRGGRDVSFRYKYWAEFVN